ncbi:MAG: hypothetical protein RLZZ219_1709 [Cyanobacteriota bacterium]
MAPSGRRPPSAPGERRTIGLFSLILGMALLVLILARGQQAAREGNQELRNDTYWVLVSPLVFSGFGLYLLSGSGRAAGRGGSLPRPPAPLQRSLGQARREAERSEQAVGAIGSDAEQRLAAARRELAGARADAEGSEQRLRQAAADSQARITALEQQLEAMRQTRDRAEADLQSLLEQGSRSEAHSPQQADVLRQRIEQMHRDLERRLAETGSRQAQALDAQQAELERLRQALSQAESAASGAGEQTATAATALEQRLGAMGERLQQLEQERGQLQAALTQLRNDQRSAAEAALASRERARTELEQLLARLEVDRQSLQGSLDRFLEQESRQLGQTRQQLEAALAQLEAARAEQTAAGQSAGRRLVEMEQQIQQAQQAGQQGSRQLASALAALEQARAGLHGGLEATRERVELAAARVSEQMGQARTDAARALQLSEEARSLLERFALERGAVAGPAGSGEDAFRNGYRQACEELGVLPGSDWAVVRASWRRNLKQWHPDQGGDPGRWMRRNAAYQLLTAWYEFDGAG